jgi:competence protein ComEC
MSVEGEIWPAPRGWGLVCTFAAERERWPLWVPVGIGGGVATYFALPFEPAAVWAPALLIAALCLGIAGFWWLRKTGRGEAIVIVAFLLGAPALGFTAVKVSSDRIAAPVLGSRLGPTMVSGRIINAEPGLKGLRLTLAVSAINRLTPSETPDRVRIRVRPSMVPAKGAAMTPAKVASGAEALGPGAEIKVLAILMPPPAPAVPGGFDFARAAWFDGIGAVGFAVRAPEVTGRGAEDGASPGWLAALRGTIGDLRGALFTRITEAVPGAAGGIAAALMTGERGRIPEDAMEAMRAAW